MPNNRPPLGQRRSTSSVQLSSRSDGEEKDGNSQSTSAPKKQAKQFVVHARHNHGRVPSHGKNLNKLAKQITKNLSHGDLVEVARQAQQLQAAGKLQSTSPGHHTKTTTTTKDMREGELKKRSRVVANGKSGRVQRTAPKKKAHFELGSEPGSTSDTNGKQGDGNEDEDDDYDETEEEIVDDDELVKNEPTDQGKDVWERVSVSVPKDGHRESILSSSLKQQQSKTEAMHDKSEQQQQQRQQQQQQQQQVQVQDQAQQPTPQKEAQQRQLQSQESPHSKVNGTIKDSNSPAKSKPDTSQMTNGTSSRPGTQGQASNNASSKAPTSDADDRRAKEAKKQQQLHRQSISFFQGAAQHPTTVPPQVTAETATAYHEQPRRKSMGQASATTSSSVGTHGHGRRDSQPVQSRFIVSDSPGRASSTSPSSPITPPAKRSSHQSSNLPLTPSATPPRNEYHDQEQARRKSFPNDSEIKRLQRSNTKSQPNRTQSKLLLQRASSHYEVAVESGKQPSTLQSMTNVSTAANGVTATAGIGGLPFEQPSTGGAASSKAATGANKEIERVLREYANVRRFVTPVGEAVTRLKEFARQNRIPASGRRPLERDGSGPGSMGLSQSLGANVAGNPAKTTDDGAASSTSAVTANGTSTHSGVSGGMTKTLSFVGLGGSKDDSGIAAKRRSMGRMDEGKVRELLQHVWNRDNITAATAAVGSN